MVIRQNIFEHGYSSEYLCIEPGAEPGKVCLIFEMFFPGKVLYLSVLKQRTETVAQRCSLKKWFLEISQNSEENTYARVSFLIKLQVKANNFIKKRD